MKVRGCVATAALVVAGVVPLAATGIAQAAPASGPNSLCAPPADTVGPTATSVTFGRATLDLDTGSRTQSVSVATQDTSGNGAASGVAQVRIEIAVDHYFATPKLTLASGTPTSGTWHGAFTVSKFAHAGTYRIRYLTVTDADHNQQNYPGDTTTADSPDALSLHPADDPTFQVTGTPATRPPRTPAGTLKSFAQSTTKVNSTSAARPVHFTARFTTPAPQHVYVTLNSADESKGGHFYYRRVSLHKDHGTWTGTLHVDRWLGDQHLQTDLAVQYGSHYRPGSRNYDATKLHHLHFDHDVAVRSGIDDSKPHLTALSISPDPIDSTTGAELVTVTARAGDTGSGVKTIDLYGSIHNGVNGATQGLYPYAASGIGYLSSQELHVRLHRTASGWTGTTKVRQCVPSGTYKLSADVNDVAGNSRYYSTKQLAKSNLISTVDVTSKHGDVVAPEVYSAATYGADRALFLNFSEGVSHVDTSTLTVYALSPSGTRYQSAVPISAIDCSNGTDHIACSGTGGLVTSAQLTVPALAPGKKYEVYANLDQVVPQLTDGNGNPLDWNYAAAEVLDS